MTKIAGVISYDKWNVRGRPVFFSTSSTQTFDECIAQLWLDWLARTNFSFMGMRLP